MARIALEATGPYHKAFEVALGEAFPLVKVNPLQARRFAEAHDTRAKTDAVDARMLARMGAHSSSHPKRRDPEKRPFSGICTSRAPGESRTARDCATAPIPTIQRS